MATAAISAGASILGGLLGGKGAEKAAQTQAAAYQSGINEQRRQFDITQGNFAPFQQAGVGALSSVQDLLGLHGGTVQSSAIDALRNSPGFTSVYNQGKDAILQSAAATGGLRGGNTQNSLAQFGSGLLAQQIQQQLGALGGLVNNGLGATNNLGQLGAANSAQIANLLAQQGQSNAAGAAAPYATWANILSGLGGQLSGGGFGGGSNWFNRSASDPTANPF